MRSIEGEAVLKTVTDVSQMREHNPPLPPYMDNLSASSGGEWPKAQVQLGIGEKPSCKRAKAFKLSIVKHLLGVRLHHCPAGSLSGAAMPLKLKSTWQTHGTISLMVRHYPAKVVVIGQPVSQFKSEWFRQ